MQQQLLNMLVCPVTKGPLTCTIITLQETEVTEALLISEAGFIFPVIGGIPRLLVEGIYDYKDFLKKHIAGFENHQTTLFSKHKELIEYCYKKNKQSKASFAFEWGFLNNQKKDRLWMKDTGHLSSILQKELGCSLQSLQGKTCIDIGSGHGLMTQMLAQHSHCCIGVEASTAVEKAYEENKLPNAFFVQADLQFLPFAEKSFDVLYSSGVIHHTNSTANSFKLIEPLVKNRGRLCLWLYHPQKNRLHHFFLLIRRFTRKLPLKMAFALLLVFVFPFSFIYKKIKGNNPPNFREEMINLLDMFTPEFREEIEHETAAGWLKEAGYNSIAVTTEDQFGFSISGTKT